MRLPTTRPTSVLVVFLSSGDDVLELRKLVKMVIDDAINPVLLELGIPIRLELDIWERTAGHRVPAGEGPNDEFVRRACAAHLVLAILDQVVGPGTREELDAVIAEPDVELAIVWCAEREQPWPTTALGAWLGPQRGTLYIDRAGGLGTDGPKNAIFKVLFQAALTAIGNNDDRGPIHEQR
jgi:hypothetical protein